MSEYQYYEFLALDQPLTEEQIRTVRKCSTRARITATSFVNEYHWGDFKGDVHKLMTKFYDAFVYFANWGTRDLQFRIPKHCVDLDMWDRYCVPYSVELCEGGKSVVLCFGSQNEGDGDWDGDAGWMSALAPLRSDLLGGDLRCLYLGWLSGVQGGEVDEEQREPPVPQGLSELTAPLRALADFLRIDDSLMEAAAEASDPLGQQQDSADSLHSKIESLPLHDKEELLARLVMEPPAVVQRDLRRRLREGNGPRVRTGDEGRSVEDLLASAERRTEEKRRHLAEVRARQRAREEKEAEKARQALLDDLARREPQAWAEVEALVAMRQPKAYDKAVELLTDLRDLAERQSRQEKAQSHLNDLRKKHGRKHALMRRLEAASL